jgi:hypothetical protein
LIRKTGATHPALARPGAGFKNPVRALTIVTNRSNATRRSGCSLNAANAVDIALSILACSFFRFARPSSLPPAQSF